MIDKKFQELSADVVDVMIAQHTRPHIMMLIGGFFMSNTSRAKVQFMYIFLLQNLQAVRNYNCGVVVLASLYHGLDQAIKSIQIDIGGCLFLLQS